MSGPSLKKRIVTSIKPRPEPVQSERLHRLASEERHRQENIVPMELRLIEGPMMRTRLGIFFVAVLSGTATAQAPNAQAPTPPVATNQCWDNSTNQLRDNNSAAMGAPEGQDRSAGKIPAPASGNAATGGARNPNAVRPPGVADC
jgi:hypothetical protein